MTTGTMMMRVLEVVREMGAQGTPRGCSIPGYAVCAFVLVEAVGVS